MYGFIITIPEFDLIGLILSVVPVSLLGFVPAPPSRGNPSPAPRHSPSPPQVPYKKLPPQTVGAMVWPAARAFIVQEE